MNKKTIFLILCLFFQHNMYAVIRIVCTSALADAHFELRKQQYIKSFTMLRSLGYYNFYIVEALKKSGPTFLEEYTQNVFYSTVNNPSLRNHGINEAMTFLEGCKYFNFADDDLIIKLTGRHPLTSGYFLDFVKNHSDADAIVKVNSDGNVFTVAFAMKYKHLKEMYATIDYAYINQHMIPIEYRVGDYIKRKKIETNFTVYYMDKLDVTADISGSTTAPGATGIRIF